MARRGRQADDEARAGAVADGLRRVPLRSRRVAGSGPIFRPDAAEMRLDDLARDREAEPRILAETFDRPIGVKPLENPFQRVGGNARAVVVDVDDDRGRPPPR